MVISRTQTTCIFGERRIDLRSAKLAAAEARPELLLLFGGAGVAPAVQETVRALSLSGTTAFGSFELERF